jgi:hypothetical protein
MPLPGGAAAKFGERYEGRWTVLQLADLLAERAQSIRLEPPGAEGEGIEFWIRQSGRLSYHQVKRQAPRGRGWSIDDLGRAGVLVQLFRRAEDSFTSCVFVSADSSAEMRELIERSIDAADWDEFDREFLKSAQVRTNFQKLCAHLKDLSAQEVFERLKRFEIRSVDEATLQAFVESRLLPLVDGEPSTVTAVLAQFALDNVHHELTPDVVWRHLESEGLRPRDWAKDQIVVQAVARLNSLYVERLSQHAIGRRILPRSETDGVLEALADPGVGGGVLVTGEAGVGKSGVVQQVLDKLRRSDVPVLAFRVDALDPVGLPRDVGKQLGLPNSPAVVLAALAQKRPSVLVIDQLDAVSLASGRNPLFFECLQEVIRQASAYRNMKTVLVCRKFDLENDRRFASMLQPGAGFKAVTVGRLSRDAVVAVLRDLGYDPERFDKTQHELLTVPLHLALLAEIATHHPIEATSFETVNDLYERFWDHKQKLVEVRLGRGVAWTQVIDILCRYMSDRQTLVAPVSTLDEFRLDADGMVSEGVIARYRDRFGFFHEGFFDYCFARRFTGRGESLIPFLKTGEQHLFRRAQVRQVLLHERDSEPERYRNDLRALLGRSDIRPHIKDVVRGLLAALRDPTREEWEILEGLPAAGSVGMSQQSWRVIYGSGAWFQLLRALGVIERWLAQNDEELADQVVWFLRGVQRQAADDVAKLLVPYVGRGQSWNRRLLYVAQWSEPGAGVRFLDLFVRLIDAGVLDEARGPVAVNSEFWSMVYGLPTHQPDWAAKVIGHYFSRRLALALGTGEMNPFEPDTSQMADRFFLESAQRAPQAFVEEILAVMLRIMDANAVRDGEPPWRDNVWAYRQVGRALSVHEALLEAMEAAVGAIANGDPGAFREISRRLAESNFETAQYLLVRGLTAAGAGLANEAADYVIGEPSCLETGYMGNSHWAARELLSAISPHCGESRLRRLEGLILRYYPRWERTAPGRRSHGHAQFMLLGGLDPGRRSAPASRRYQELERKFGPQGVTPPRPVEVVSVGSPVLDSAGEMMTDDQWLVAIAKYFREDMREAGARLVGGARELAHVLESQVKRDPERFAMLASRFPDEANPTYFDAVLRGLSQTVLDSNVAAEVCRRVHRLPNRPCGRDVVHLIEKMDASTIPGDVLEILAWYATEDGDPGQELWRTESWSGKPYYGGDIFTAGLNSVRGAAAIAMARIFFESGVTVSRLIPILEKMVRDPSVAVRACVAETLIAVLRYDRDLAVRLFLDLTKTEDVFLATRDSDRFLHYGLQTHSSDLIPVVERMLRSDIAMVRTTGARRAAMISLLNQSASELAMKCMRGDEAQRVGVAEVYAANVGGPYQEVCSAGLKRLFTDESEAVRGEAASFPRHLQKGSIAALGELIEDFVGSPAFSNDSFSLIHALEEVPAELPRATLLVCRRFVERVGSEAGDIRSRVAMEASIVGKLLVRVYAQSTDEAFKSECLDVIDGMVEIGAFGFGDVLAAFER